MEITVNLTKQMVEILQKRVDDYNTNILPTMEGGVLPLDIKSEVQFVLEQALLESLK